MNDNQFSLVFLKCLIGIKKNKFSQSDVTNFNNAREHIYNKRDDFKIKFTETTDKVKFNELEYEKTMILTDRQVINEAMVGTGTTRQNLSYKKAFVQLLELLSKVVDVSLKDFDKETVIELTNVTTNPTRTTGCGNVINVGDLINNYIANGTIDPFDGTEKEYNEIKTFIFDTKKIGNVGEIRKKITELFTKTDDQSFNNWIKINLKRDDITYTDVNCLKLRTSYIFLFYLFLVAYEKHQVNSTSTLLDSIMYNNNNVTNHGKLSLLTDNKNETFSLDARQSITVERFSHFNKETPTGEYKVKNKACFLFHGVGTGKTLTSLSIALTHLNANHTKDSPLTIIIIAPEGLFQSAFLGDDAARIGIFVEAIEYETHGEQYFETASGAVDIDGNVRHIRFIGYDYNILKANGLQLLNDSLDGNASSVLICDEAHRLVLNKYGIENDDADNVGYNKYTDVVVAKKQKNRQ